MTKKPRHECRYCKKKFIEDKMVCIDGSLRYTHFSEFWLCLECERDYLNLS